VEAHIAMADFHARAGKLDLAIYFYRVGLELAERQELGEEQVAEVNRAKSALATLEQRAHAKREARLAQRGLPPGLWSPRLRQSLDIAAGSRRLHRSQPTAFDYVGLPAIQFFDREMFDWAERIEVTTPAIHGELLALLETHADELRPYVQHNTVAPEANQALLGRADWSVLPLCENGWLMPSIIERCPRTWEAVLQTPLPRISGWGPTVLFSLLKAGARIAPHSGMFNTRLICHLPLIVPSGCRFRVGNEVREWEVGKLLIFDDTIEHEAWNDSGEDRVILIFDIWRPELSEQEKLELTALFSD
jgi:aspartyl/asparaginyl beta-hydroxylase (cupin superfamily)